jgi:hypothetical protein
METGLEELWKMLIKEDGQFKTQINERMYHTSV